MPDVRLMTDADADAVATLFAEMQSHYRVPCPPLSEIIANLSTLPAGVNMFVATDPDVVGFAALGAIFPGPGLKPGLFLKELFVSAKARGCGIGTKLMRAAAGFAVERGFSRLDWTADRGDVGLLRFYADLGAIEQSEKIFYRLSGDILADLASSGPGR